MTKRVFLIVLDSFGIGELPDAENYGDKGSNTLKAVSRSEKFNLASLKKLGLFNIDGVDVCEKEKAPLANFCRIAEKSKGKDTTTGHWEIAGIITEKPFPTYPDGFPIEITEKLENETGRGILCNKPYSGTKLLLDYGEEHIKTGKLIVYTSADSVLQIAAHEDVVPVEKLYEYCKIARKIMTGKHSVGRIIARPFTGAYPEFTRTSRRHDFSLVPPKDTMCDILCKNNIDVIGVGKIFDIFAGKGIQKTFPTKNNDDGMEKIKELQNEDFNGLAFINLVDFDMVYGHRNDVDGYAGALTKFDEFIGGFIEDMRNEDVLIITADHGCDPSTESTDHSREYIPLLIYGKELKNGVNLGTRMTFSDIGRAVLDLFSLKGDICGESFLHLIK
ncbi:MAG TPA: phosphopentomutase [Oscillospiraceae bacterium]|nr:phosphopentomutase [Oscillospiraceae bacterium]